METTHRFRGGHPLPSGEVTHYPPRATEGCFNNVPIFKTMWQICEANSFHNIPIEHVFTHYRVRVSTSIESHDHYVCSFQDPLPRGLIPLRNVRMTSTRTPIFVFSSYR